MTAKVDMVNRALQTFGSRTTVTAAELASNGSNEAIQANIIYDSFRRRLLRMAPWSFAFQTIALNFITSIPGTPENTSPATQLWQKGQPAPPWAYEYQYPFDCIRACWITPQTATGFAGGVPITTAVTGGAASFWQGPPVQFKIAVDQFFAVTAATVASGGAGYALGDLITLAQSAQGLPPVGCPATLQVTGVGALGVVTSVAIVPIIPNEAVPFSGSYFAPVANPSAQGPNPGNLGGTGTTGLGTGATFNLTFTAAAGDQRVILTNQEFGLLNYVKNITDENVFDDDFQEAYAFVLGGALCKALTGDKSLSNLVITQGNEVIRIARGNDGNEALTVNNVIPDWIRMRGVDYTDGASGPYNTGFDWGGMWPGFS